MAYIRWVDLDCGWSWLFASTVRLSAEVLLQHGRGALAKGVARLGGVWRSLRGPYAVLAHGRGAFDKAAM